MIIHLLNVMKMNRKLCELVNPSHTQCQLICNPITSMHISTLQSTLGISGERIWSEIKKILTGRLADKLVQYIINMDLIQHLGNYVILCNSDYEDFIFINFM